MLLQVRQCCCALHTFVRIACILLVLTYLVLAFAAVLWRLLMTHSEEETEAQSMVSLVALRLVQLGKLDLPEGKLKYDEFFGESEVYLEDVFAPLPIARATPEAMTLELELNYQGCAEGGLCYPPTTRIVAVDLPEARAIAR